jgi:hypothetical protein
MTLSEYLLATRESGSAFARRAGVPIRTINRVCAGDGCTATTALAIIRATHHNPTPGGGSVSLEDLVDAEVAA